MRPTLLGLALAVVACDGSTPSSPDPSKIDADGDGFAADRDCDDHDPLVWQSHTVYRDADGDGLGAGPGSRVCFGARVPDGYSMVARDCDDEDPTPKYVETVFVDADGDGLGAGPPVTLCTAWAPPPGYARKDGDCDDADPTRTNLVTAYFDTDGDGVGAGPEVHLCTGLAPGKRYVSITGDCAPDDPSRWRELPYQYRDADRDGYTVVSEGVVCSGDTLPESYRDTPGWGEDCDDLNPSLFRRFDGYVDLDGDGVGEGPLVSICGGDFRPGGYASSGGDCSPQDPTRWQFISYSNVDRDGDGYTHSEYGQTCSGWTLPPPYRSEPNGDDCNDWNPSVFSLRQGYFDVDGDGYGTGPAYLLCSGASLPKGYAAEGDDCAPNDASRWLQLSYDFVDVDGDGFTVPQSGAACTAGTLPDPYRVTANGNDCDDAQAGLWRWVVLYHDADGDGVGARPRTVKCRGDTLPVGFSTFGWDADDSNPKVQGGTDDEELLLSVGG